MALWSAKQLVCLLKPKSENCFIALQLNFFNGKHKNKQTIKNVEATVG